MIGIYLSGTGNTKHCIEKLTKLLDSSAKTMPLEWEDVVEEIRNTTTIIDGKAVADNKCTMCYRCISHCPQKAITLVGNEVKEQYNR